MGMRLMRLRSTRLAPSVPSTLPHAGSLGDDGLEGFLKATWRRACLARAKALVRAPLDTLEAGTLPMWIDLSNLRSSSSRLLTGGVAASSSTLPRPNCDGALSEEVSEWCATSEEDFGGNGRDSPPSVCSLLRDGGKLILPRTELGSGRGASEPDAIRRGAGAMIMSSWRSGSDGMSSTILGNPASPAVSSRKLCSMFPPAPTSSHDGSVMPRLCLRDTQLNSTTLVGLQVLHQPSEDPALLDAPGGRGVCIG
eukprot:scaffold313494_cov33-Tisochrysis_lutea.AAC.3